jgi:hypothetical protein
MNSSIDHRKPSPKNKLKKRDSAPTKSEERYSIASLLQKKQASRTNREDDKWLDEEDLQAVDAAIAQSETMRKDAIATTSFSPIKTPSKKPGELVQGVDESFLFIPQSPEEEDHSFEEGNSLEGEKAESAPISYDNNANDAVNSNSIAESPVVDEMDAAKTPRRDKGKSARRKHRSRNHLSNVEDISMPVSPPNHHDDMNNSETWVPGEKPAATSATQPTEATDLEPLETPEENSGIEPPTVLDSEYLSIRDRTEDISPSRSKQDRLAIQAQRISKFKNSIWSAVGSMVAPRRNSDYNPAVDEEQIPQAEAPAERIDVPDLDCTSSINHFSVTEELELKVEQSDNDNSDFHPVTEETEVEEEHSNNDIYDFSNHASSNDSSSEIEPSENDSKDGASDDDEEENVKSEGGVEMDDAVSNGSYNEFWDHSNNEELSCSDNDSGNDEASDDVSVDNLVSEVGTLKGDNNMSFGTNKDTSLRSQKFDNSFHQRDTDPSFSYNNDDSNGSPTWRVDDNILDSEGNDIELGGTTKSVGDDENDFTSRMEASIDHRQRKQKQKRMLAYGMILCCIIMVVVLVTVLVVLLPKSNASNEAEAYNAACDAFPSQPVRCETFVTAFETNHPNSTWINLMEPDKCQFKTLEWLIESTSDDNVKLLNNPKRIRQRYALAVFHCELFGDEWFKKDFHLLGDDNECTWSTDDLGVENDGTPKKSCNSFGDILTVRIKDEEFLGTLAPEVSMISTLQELSLPDNHIVGSIPTEYTSLTELERVILSSNQITGTLPSFMYDVAYLDLSMNKINGTIPTPPEYTSGASNITRQLATQPRLISLILHTNVLTGSIPIGLVHPLMRELVLHSNLFSGEFIPPSIDAAKSLERLTLNDNNLTGNVNALCSLSSLNGGLLRTFAVDISEITCGCCISSESNNIFHSPTLAVPGIPPPTMAPNVSLAPTASIPVLAPTALPTLSLKPSYAPSTISLPMNTTVPTPGAIAIPGSSTQAPTISYNASSASLMPTQASVGVTLPPTAAPELVFPFTNVTTTPLDPFVPGDCYFKDNAQPHVINQCNCYNSISIMYNDTMNLYTEMRKAISQEFYGGVYNTTIDSCQAQNQAMVWLSSGKTRDNGDLYQRFVLAVVYIQMHGIKWNNRTRWLSNWNECTWFGVECDTSSKIRALRLDANNVLGSLPSEIKHLQSLETISVRNNQVNGNIPSDIVTLPRIKHLILSNNNITGSIPSFLVSSTSLQTIQFDNNNLYGTIPPWIRSNSNLSLISLNNNGLYGSIPTELSSIQNLTTLYLHDNKLTGTSMQHMVAAVKLSIYYSLTSHLKHALQVPFHRRSVR